MLSKNYQVFNAWCLQKGHSYLNQEITSCNRKLHVCLRRYEGLGSEAVVCRCPLKKLFLKSSQYSQKNTCAGVFFSIWVFFHEHSRTTGLQGKGESSSLTPHYHFHPLHRHSDVSRAITARSSPLRIASSWNRTGNLWLPSESR